MGVLERHVMSESQSETVCVRTSEILVLFSSDSLHVICMCICIDVILVPVCLCVCVCVFFFFFL